MELGYEAKLTQVKWQMCLALNGVTYTNSHIALHNKHKHASQKLWAFIDEVRVFVISS